MNHPITDTQCSFNEKLYRCKPVQYKLLYCDSGKNCISLVSKF